MGRQQVAADDFDSGDGVQAVAAVARELRDAGRLLIAVAGERHLHGEHVVRVEAGTDTACRARKVRISSAEPISSTRASETSLITSSERALPWRKPVPERLLLSFRVEFRSVREALNAGKSPKRMPVSSETARVKASTRQSTPTAEPSSPMRGRPAGLTASRARTPGEAEQQGRGCRR